MKDYIHREIEGALKIAAEQSPAVIITGPRQSGKTTLLSHLFLKDHRYISLDDPNLRLMARDEPGIFFENYPPPVIIDEIQYAPQLFSYIKLLIDKNRDAKGQFLLTGSQTFPLMANVSDSLAGRIAVLTLLSLSYLEQFQQAPLKELNILKKRVLTGGFPEVVKNEDINLDLWFSGYLQTYLERDVRQLRQIGELSDFARFLQLLASLSGQILNLSNLSRDLGVAVNTVKAWLAVLEATKQIILVQPFYINKGKRLIKSPKLYFLDTGLLCYLSGITSTEQVFKGVSAGPLFETVVLSEIIRCFYNRGKIDRIFWWRTSSGSEVDFIIEDKGKIIPIEVKLSSKANKQMAKGLISFCELFDSLVDMAFLVNLSEEPLKIDKKITSIPFSDFIGQKWLVK